MPPSMLLGMRTKTFVDCGTLASFSAVAKQVAKARHYISEIQKIEDQLMRDGHESPANFRMAMEETAQMAEYVSNETLSAIRLLKGIKAKIEAFIPETDRATD